MQRNLRNILIITFLLLLAISPVAAQDNDPGTIVIDSPEAITITQPGDGDGSGVGGILPYQFIGLVGLVVFVLLFTAYESHNQRKLHLEAIDRLFKSTPPIIRDPAFGFVSGLGDNILMALDNLADATTWTDLDDRAQQQVAAYWAEAKARWQELKQGFTPALSSQSSPAVDRMRSISAAQTLLSAEGWTLTPPGGYDAEWLDRDKTDTNWQGTQGPYTPGSGSVPGDRASYLSDEQDADFTDDPPKG